MIRRILVLLNPFSWLEAVKTNPVILKEMRSRMRGWRALAALTSFLIVIAAAVGMIYIGFAGAGNILQGVTIRKTVGQTIFYTIFMIQLFIVGITSSGMTSSAIASEREQQTYDLLRTTLLSARSLVIGKLIASVSFVLLLLVASLPILSVGFIFGGVSLGEVLIGVLILFLTALNFGSIGLFFSSFIRRARIAAVISQVITLTFSIALPIITLAGFAILDTIWLGSSNGPPEWLFLGIGWMIAIGSPVVTAIVSEAFLMDSQTFFFLPTTINGVTIPVLSPWIGFTLLYIVLTIFFLALTIQIVRRPDKQ